MHTICDVELRYTFHCQYRDEGDNRCDGKYIVTYEVSAAGRYPTVNLPAGWTVVSKASVISQEFKLYCDRHGVEVKNK